MLSTLKDIFALVFLRKYRCLRFVYLIPKYVVFRNIQGKVSQNVVQMYDQRQVL